MPYPNVQACLGIQIVRSRNPFSRDWWEAIGPARATFDQAVDTIDTILDSTIKKLRQEGFHGEMSYELYMIGHKSTSAQPVIMFFSPKEAMPRKEARRAVDDARRDGQLPMLTDFLTGHKALEPGIGRLQQPATQNNFEHGPSTLVWHTDVFFDPLCTTRATAMPIWVKHGVSNWRQATAYTVFKDGECMLMTVSHVFRDNVRDLSDTSSSDNNEYDLGSGTEYEEDETDITSRGSASSGGNEPGVDRLASISQASDSSTSSDHSKSGRGVRRRCKDEPSLSVYPTPATLPNQFGRALEKLGELLQSPPESIDQDWALVKTTSESVKSALQKDKSVLNRILVTAFTPRENTHCVVHASRKKMYGQLSGFSTRMLLPGSTTFQRLYRLHLGEAVISGDSGAVVMNALTDRVYGHIVAASETGRIAFVIPASTIHKSAGTVWGPPSPNLSTAFAPDQLPSDPQALERLDSTQSLDAIPIIGSPPRHRKTSEPSGDGDPSQKPDSSAGPADEGPPSSTLQSPADELYQTSSSPKQRSFRRAANSLRGKVEDVATKLSFEGKFKTTRLKERAAYLRKRNVRLDTVRSPPTVETLKSPPMVDTVKSPPIVDTMEPPPTVGTVKSPPIVDTMEPPPTVDTMKIPPTQRKSLSKKDSFELKVIREDIYRQLLSCRVGGPGKKVILPEQVKRIWTGIYYHKIYTSQMWYDKSWDMSGIMNHYIQIMSILICIQFDEWSKFRTVFMDPRLDDSRIPFRLVDLQSMRFRDTSLPVKFYDAQWLFCPCRIRERQEVYPIEEKRRLPWLDEGRAIGEGAIGNVSKRTIAAGYLESRDGAVNLAPRTVAVKTVANMEYSRREFDSQQVLQECLSKHSRVMTNFATLLETNTESNNHSVHHFVYELAAYDLNTFLTMQPSRLSSSSNQRSSLVELHSQHMWPGDLIAESMNLADALDFLHNRIFTNRSISLVHNNLTPHNILVVYPDNPDDRNRYPVGQWKLADFGLSTLRPLRKLDRITDFDPIPYQDRDELALPGESIVSAKEHMRMREPGRYTPPEWEHAAPQMWDGPSADLWSFGCVFSEILTYAIRLDPRTVEDLRHAILGPDQRFYDPVSLEVKPEFRFYLDDLPELWPGYKGDKMAASWVDLCVDLIRGIVVADPGRRFRARYIRDVLQKTHGSMAGDKERWLQAHGVTQEKVAGRKTAKDLNDISFASNKSLSVGTHYGSVDFSMSPKFQAQDLQVRRRSEFDGKLKESLSPTSRFTPVQRSGY